MKKQEAISKAKHKAMVGREVEVLVDGPSKESEFVFAGRLATQAPDVDGQVYLVSPPEDLRPGTFRRVRITRAAAHDLVGEVVEGEVPRPS